MGLSNIFNEKIDGLNIHRPLVSYTKKQIKIYASKNNLIWFEDRSNIELDYSRNKIRSYIKSNLKISKPIEKEIKSYQDIEYIFNFHSSFFKRLSKKRFEIESQKFKFLNKTLQIFAVQSLYYCLRLNLKKQPRNENILNFIEVVLVSHQNMRLKRSVFGGKIGFFEKKLYLNLT